MSGINVRASEAGVVPEMGLTCRKFGPLPAAVTVTLKFTAALELAVIITF